MVSPWPPSTKAVTSSTETPSSVAMKVRQPARLAQHPHHRIERVGDADHEGAGTVLLDRRADLAHDLGIGAEQVVTAHAGLARDAGGDDHDVGAGDRRVVGATRDGGVEIL